MAITVTINGDDWTQIPSSSGATIDAFIVGGHVYDVLIQYAAAKPPTYDRGGQEVDFLERAPLSAPAGQSIWVRSALRQTLGLGVVYLGGGGAADPITALRAAQVTALTGETVAPGRITVNDNLIFRNNTAAPITVPATTTVAAMTAAGFTEEVVTQIDEVVLSVTDLTGPAPAGAKVGRNVTTGQEFSVEGGNWSAETATADVWNEIVVVPAVPADTWTAIPVGTLITNPVTVTPRAGEADFVARQSGASWSIMSSVARTNVEVIIWR